MAVGGIGVISVIANILPKETANLCAAMEKGDLKTAQDIHYKLLPLIKAMFIETNPAPIKTAMGILGMCSDELRLPLSPMTAENVDKLKQL